MAEKVILNDVTLSVTDFYEGTVVDKTTGKELRIVGFDFKVTSSEYHDITTLLYKNDFQVEVPEKEIKFQATIRNYSTSLTNLYEKNQVGDYKLELIEQV